MRSGDRAAETYSHEYEGIEAMPQTLGISITFIVVGCACLVFGANWFIGGAVGVARSLGVSEAVIGLTLVALGTSLPELTTSLVAAARQEGEMAFGNVLGSNIFNIFGIMGVTAMVAPVAVPAEVLTFDIWIMLGVALLLATLSWHGGRIGRGLGLGLFIAYLAYVALQFQGLSA